MSDRSTSHYYVGVTGYMFNNGSVVIILFNCLMNNRADSVFKVVFLSIFIVLLFPISLCNTNIYSLADIGRGWYCALVYYILHPTSTVHRSFTLTSTMTRCYIWFLSCWNSSFICLEYFWVILHTTMAQLDSISIEYIIN